MFRKSDKLKKVHFFLKTIEKSTFFPKDFWEKEQKDRHINCCHSLLVFFCKVPTYVTSIILLYSK